MMEVDTLRYSLKEAGIRKRLKCKATGADEGQVKGFTVRLTPPYCFS